ncbi:MAG: class I SAM-dependent methyltransferase [Solimonas sp.]
MDQRDFASISPSARAILLVRSQTDLPFARRAAELLLGREAVEKARDEMASNADARARRTHFERRSRSIDEALARMGARRVLEIASGFSFRGLAMASSAPDAFYLDTDLPDVIEQKKALVEQLHPGPPAGRLELRALDVFDAAAFRAAVDALPPGPVAIVQEGLFMYLDDAEKRTLARTVLDALRARGGAWITADVYVRTGRTIFRDGASRAFVEKHGIDAKKFATYDDALAFFTAAGFRVDARLACADAAWQARETWVLVPDAEA